MVSKIPPPYLTAVKKGIKARRISELTPPVNPLTINTFLLKRNGVIPMDYSDVRAGVNCDNIITSDPIFEFRLLLAFLRSIMILSHDDYIILEKTFPLELKQFLLTPIHSCPKTWIFVLSTKETSSMALRLRNEIEKSQNDENPFIIGTLLGYPLKDIHFYYTRCPGLGLGNDRFLSDRNKALSDPDFLKLIS